MGSLFIYVVILLVLFILELVYFRIADRYNIIDKPNHRSSHTQITIRGGGIIFSLAAMLWFIYSGYSYPYFTAGLLLIAAISFMDDVATLKSSIRSLVHLLAVSLLLYQLDLNLTWFWYPLILILIIGTINAYNFMDGINGITGGYSTILILTLLYVNYAICSFTDTNLLVFSLLSLAVFNFFNFHKKAKCFAGDVGSLSIAFIVCFLLIQLIIQSQNLLFIGFLLIYGLDSVTTILFRLIRRENIFEAHRSHFYQYLANERKWSHLSVSALYLLLQALINLMILAFADDFADFQTSAFYLTGTLLITGLAFIGLRMMIEGKDKLLKSHLV
jgi:UDP-N-acetylmuramyl pentapeptide phosphotransferase/UDP-N-acetylglucosamine-1-phosphate transferase